MVSSGLPRTFSRIRSSSGLRPAAAPARAGGASAGRCLTTDEAYLKALSGKTTTTTLPGASGTTANAPARAIAELGPAVMLSSRFSRRQRSNAAWFVTSTCRSYSSGR